MINVENYEIRVGEVFEREEETKSFEKKPLKTYILNKEQISVIELFGTTFVDENLNRWWSLNDVVFSIHPIISAGKGKKKVSENKKTLPTVNKTSSPIQVSDIRVLEFIFNKTRDKLLKKDLGAVIEKLINLM